jgi:hypothetical protein
MTGRDASKDVPHRDRLRELDFRVRAPMRA